MQLQELFSLHSGEVVRPTDSFHRNWENNLVWFSLLVLEDSKIRVCAKKMSWGGVALPPTVPAACSPDAASPGFPDVATSAWGSSLPVAAQG